MIAPAHTGLRPAPVVGKPLGDARPDARRTSGAPGAPAGPTEPVPRVLLAGQLQLHQS